MKESGQGADAAVAVLKAGALDELTGSKRGSSGADDGDEPPQPRKWLGDWLPEGMLLDVSRKRTSRPASVLGPPGLDGDCLVAPDGRTYRLADARLSPQRAYELVVAGAVVAFDDCGCDGWCGLAWADHDRLQRLVRHGPPRVRREGKGFSLLEEWRTDTGDPLVVARGDVRWA